MERVMKLYTVFYGAIILATITNTLAIGYASSSFISSRSSEDRLMGISFFSPRSQSTNAARDMAGWHPYIHRYDAESIYGAFTVTPAYYKSIRVEHISETLFGTSAFNVSGSFVTNRMSQDILADYFGLSPTFESTVFLKPRIQNAMLIANGFLGLDAVAPGLYMSAMIPFVWTEWNLHMHESIFNEGSNTPYPAGYMAANALTAPAKSFVQALNGTITFGQMQQPLTHGKVDGGHTKIGVSDIQLALGWDFILREHGYAGINIRMSAPTGSRPKSEYLFEPIVGNGKHWELGLGFSGRVLLWEADGEQTLSFFADANVTHLFKATQHRSFDLKCHGFGSRYMLIKEFDNAGNYTGNLAPAINKTTLRCKVNMDIELDLAIMFGYVRRGFAFDIGYNAWFRSKEKISIDQPFLSNSYGLKGIQNVTNSLGALTNTTQSTATLMGNFFGDQAAVADPNSPVFISPCSLSTDSAASPRLLTHKFFAYCGYGFEDILHETITPLLGLGGEIEFEGVNPRNIVLPPVRTTLSQWGIWIKAGCAFA